MIKNRRLLARWYPPRRSCVNAALAGVLTLTAASATAQPAFAPESDCPTSLVQRFAPADPDGVNRYTVCHSPRSIEELARPGWTIQDATVDDAFVGIAPVVRRALALLYHGRGLKVARGWLQDDREVESVTLIAPPPDNALGSVAAGTLIVVARVDR